MKIKFLSLLTIFVLGLFLIGASAIAEEAEEEELITFENGLAVSPYIKVNGDYYETTESVSAEKGDSLTIRVKVYNLNVEADYLDDEGKGDISKGNLDNIVIKADILGYKYDTDGLSDQERISVLETSRDDQHRNSVTKTLELDIPENVDKDYYDIRLTVSQRSGEIVVMNLQLKITGKEDKLAIKDVVLSPDNEVVAGRYLIASVRVKNYGESTEEGIKVKVSIPELGVSESDYIDELEEDESTTSEELLLRIPVDAKDGEYTVRTIVEYDEGTDVETREDTINVVSAAYVPSEEKTVVNVGIESQSLKAGQSTVYPIMITNTASTAKTYTVSVSGVAGWGSAVIQPSNVLTIAGGETSTVSVSLSVNSDASSGEKAFVVEVQSPTKSAQIPLKAVVDGKATSTWSRVKTGLEIALIVLVVLLVIIGLIIGFNRLKGDEEEEGEEKTYY